MIQIQKKDAIIASFFTQLNICALRLIWNINLTAMMEGAIGLNNSYVGFLGRAFMHSPLYDLTPFGNKASFDITLASTDVTTAVIALAYVDEDSYLQEIESFEVPVSAEWTKQQVKFTKGGEAVCVLVYPKDGTYLMLQNFKLTINMPQDSKIEVPYNRATKEGELSHKFENIVLEAGDRIGYDVIAAEIAGRDKFTSETSNRVWVELESSSVDGLKAQDAPVVYMSGNVLNVENPTGAAVEVYNMAGVKVFSDNSGEAVVRTQLDMRGAYIVKVGNTAVKVMR